MNIIRNLLSFLKQLNSNSRMDWHGNASIKTDCTINANAVIYGNYSLYKARVDFGTAIGKNANISYTTIGKFCSIGPNFLCGWGIHPIDGISINPAFYSTAKQNGFTYSKTNKTAEREPITIGSDVFIGANVTVLDGVTIGDGAVIGAGAVVSKDIPPYAVAVGCPIKIIKYRFSPDVVDELLALQWWNGDEETFRKVERNFYDVSAFLADVRSTDVTAEIR